MAADGLAKIVDDSPSLQGYRAEVFTKAYAAARRRAARLLGRQDLPKECPWPLEQVTDESFWPESVNSV
jgi:hypothetical protein